MKRTWVMFVLVLSAPAFADYPLVLQSYFGEKDGAVAAMRGVVVSVSPTIPLYDLTHEIPSYDIWEASFRLTQTVVLWGCEPTASIDMSCGGN